jgi:hypothetical protein
MSINDVRLIHPPTHPPTHIHAGEVGFNVVLGGYFSTKRAATSVELGLWVPPSQVLNLCYSILRVRIGPLGSWLLGGAEQTDLLDFGSHNVKTASPRPFFPSA